MLLHGPEKLKFRLVGKTIELDRKVIILSFVVKDVPRETQISIKWEKMGPNGMFSNARLQHL